MAEDLTNQQKELSDLSNRLDSHNTTLTQHKSRLSVLEQLENDSDSGKSGVEELTKEFSQQIKGRLIDHIKVPDKYIRAVEAVIQESVNMLILDDPNCFREVADFIMESDFSSVELGLLNRLNPDAAETPNKNNSLARFVECERWIEPIVHSVLAHYLLVETLSEVDDSDDTGYVTLSGIVIHPNGIASFPGKVTGDTDVSSALQRKNEINKLQSDIDSFMKSLESLTAEKEQLESAVDELNLKQSTFVDKRRELEIEKAGIEAHIRTQKSIASNLVEKLSVTEFEIEKLESTKDSESKERGDLEKKISNCEKSAETIRNQMESESHILETIREERNQATSELTDVKVLVASKDEILRGFQNQIQPLEQRILDLEALMDQRQRDQLSFSERKEKSIEIIEKSKHAISSLEVKITECKNEIDRVELEKSEFLESIKVEEQSLKDSREYISKIQSELTRIEVELAEKKLHVESILDRVTEKYNIDLKEVPSECFSISLGDSGLPEVHTLSPEEIEETGATVDWEGIQEQVDQMQEKVDSMGPVNLVAIEEYEETEQRFEFLNTQHQDLTQSKEKLLEAVNRINTETREMFVQTFAKIRHNFQETFEEIFGGGKADLILVDEEDVLESGIDIVARPPGKKLQSISLLSGGEQTMTAVSLLFAIYQVKPSPFCVLDELDAPLDESNINRFLKVLRRFVTDSQFLIITHSKRTISMADILYGVTMQERGVSKIISVRFKQTGDESKSQENVLDQALKGAVA